MGRLLDLLHAVAGEKGVTFNSVVAAVPEYSDASEASARRYFSRDSEELRREGFAIERIAPGSWSTEAQAHYRYVGRRHAPLSEIDAETLRKAVARALPFADADLRQTLAMAMASLGVNAHDIGDAEGAIVARETLESAAVMRTLRAAIRDRCLLQLTYHSGSRNAITERTVEPYAMILGHGRWYLIANDVTRGAVKDFRVSRIARASRTHRHRKFEFAIPEGFDVERAAVRIPPWAGVSDEGCEAVVRICRPSGRVTGARRRAAREERARLYFASVAKIVPFARWLLEAAGDLVPIGPPDVCAEFQRQLRAASDLNRDGHNPWHSQPPAADGGTNRRETVGPGISQLRQLLFVLSRMKVNCAYGFAELENLTGIPAAYIKSALTALAERSWGYSATRIKVSGGKATLAGAPPPPPPLLVSERDALLTTLDLLEEVAGESDRALVDQARRSIAAIDTPASPGTQSFAVYLRGDELPAVRACVTSALEGRRRLELLYQSAAALEPSVREVSPYHLYFWEGQWYLWGWCHRTGALREFRLDRASDATLSDRSFRPQGRGEKMPAPTARQGGGSHTVKIRYGPAVSNRAAEVLGKSVRRAGTVTHSYPNADETWVLSHVLRFAGDAQIVEPASVRTRVVRQIERILADAEKILADKDP